MGTTCFINLTRWVIGLNKHMSFGIPMIWREPKDHVTDFYICLVCTKGYNGKNKAALKCPNLQSAMRHIPHGKDLFMQKFSQKELNDLVHELNLSKELSEFLASRLGERHMLLPDVRINFYRKRESDLLPYFSEENNFVYCTDIE